MSRPTLPHAGLVFAGAAIGTWLRYLVLLATHNPTGTFPWALFSINVSGSLLLGILGGSLFDRRPDAVGVRMFLATGILGGWTTYSSVVAGVLTLANRRAWGVDGTVLVLSLIVPVIAAGIGIVLGGAIPGRRAR